jgi:hypothetical protein
MFSFVMNPGLRYRLWPSYKIEVCLLECGVPTGTFFLKMLTSFYIQIEIITYTLAFVQNVVCEL